MLLDPGTQNLENIYSLFIRSKLCYFNIIHFSFNYNYFVDKCIFIGHYSSNIIIKSVQVYSWGSGVAGFKNSHS